MPPTILPPHLLRYQKSLKYPLHFHGSRLPCVPLFIFNSFFKLSVYKVGLLYSWPFLLLGKEFVQLFFACISGYLFFFLYGIVFFYLFTFLFYAQCTSLPLKFFFPSPHALSKIFKLSFSCIFMDLFLPIFYCYLYLILSLSSITIFASFIPFPFLLHQES